MKKTQAAVIVFSAALSAGLALPAYAGQWEKRKRAFHLGAIGKMMDLML